MIKELDFTKSKDGLIPAVVQDAATNEILMLAYMNRKAFEETVRTGRSCYWSRSRNKLWRKGEESGNIQIVKEILLDCDGDSIVLKVKQKGGACHTGSYSCYFRKLKNGKWKIFKTKDSQSQDSQSRRQKAKTPRVKTSRVEGKRQRLAESRLPESKAKGKDSQS